MASYKITSHIDNIPKATSWIEEQIKTKFDSHKLEQIKLVCHEAIINAVIHGNKNKTSKEVKIELLKEKIFVQIAIKDEGLGYDLTKHENKLENLLEEGGRGILIIKQYTDKIIYEDGTTKLYFNY